MKIIICLIGLTVSLASLSCNKRTDNQIEHDYLSNFLNGINIKKNTNWVVILPGLGCHGCIQEGEAFTKENISNENVFFVLNRIESLKILQQKINKELGKQSNVYIDIENKLNIPTDNNIYLEIPVKLTTLNRSKLTT